MSSWALNSGMHENRWERLISLAEPRIWDRILLISFIYEGYRFYNYDSGILVLSFVKIIKHNFSKILDYGVRIRFFFVISWMNFDR